MVQHMNDAVAGFRRDRERFVYELAAFEARGLGTSSYAEIVRSWIKRIDGLISAPGGEMLQIWSCIPVLTG